MPFEEHILGTITVNEMNHLTAYETLPPRVSDEQNWEELSLANDLLLAGDPPAVHDPGIHSGRQNFDRPSHWVVQCGSDSDIFKILSLGTAVGEDQE